MIGGQIDEEARNEAVASATAGLLEIHEKEAYERAAVRADAAEDGKLSRRRMVRTTPAASGTAQKRTETEIWGT